MRMRGNVHGDQKIARRVALHSLTLPAQSDLLALGDPGGDLDVELLTGRQPDALLASPDSLLQRHRHGDVDVQVEPDAAGLELERARPPGSAARAAAGIGEHAVEDVLEPAATHAARSATGAERIALETTGTTGTAARTATGKAGEARLALGVDLAAVELLALVLVAEDFIGGVDFSEALGRLRIILVAVRVMFLGELAIGALDRRSIGAPRHPQDLIGVAHPSCLLQGKSDHKPRAARPLLVSSGVSVVFLQRGRRAQLCRHGFSVWISQRPLAVLQPAPCSQLCVVPLT